MYLANTRIEPATDAEETVEEVTIWQPWKEEWQGREEFSNEIAHHERTEEEGDERTEEEGDERTEKEGDESPLNQSLEREKSDSNSCKYSLIHERKSEIVDSIKGHSNKRTIAFLNQGGKES